MRTRILLLVGCLCWPALGQEQTNSPSQTAHIANNAVFMSVGDTFGVNLAEAPEGMSLSITEEPDLKNANLLLSFSKEKRVMLLTIQNRTDRWLTYQAGIRVPKHDGFYKTSVVPLGPHLSNFESWPFPIEQLALKNFNFTAKPGRKPDKK